MTPAQHGSQSGKSAETQLLSSLNSWTKSLNETGNSVGIICLDFSKAVDSISHSKLLSVLEKIGLSGNLLLYIGDFLSNRSQSIKVGSTLSGKITVESGVFQESTVGPLPFDIFIIIYLPRKFRLRRVRPLF
jgi:hypothetical protein